MQCLVTVVVWKGSHAYQSMKNQDHRCNLVNNWGGGWQNQPWVLGILINERVKLKKMEKIGLFNFFHSLHYPSNCFENISVFYLPLFNSVAKKKNYS